MRRNNYPFNAKQYVLNKNTFEVHNLDQETPSCQIDVIKKEHICSCDSYIEAMLHSTIDGSPKCNGCAFCMPEAHTN